MKIIILALLLVSSMCAVEKVNLDYIDEDESKNTDKIELTYSKKSPEFKELKKSPYKTDLVIKYLNTGLKNKSILRDLYKVSINETIKEKIIEQLEKKEVYKNTKDDTLSLLLEEGKFNRLIRVFNDKIIYSSGSSVFKTKALAIKAALVKNEDKYLYNEYTTKGLRYGSNKYLFYFYLQKTFFEMKNYLYAYKYLNYIEENDYYKYIEEDLLNLTYLGTKQFYEEKNYSMAWYMAVEGMKYVDKVSTDRNIDKILYIKEILFKTSQTILADKTKNKIKDKSLYIIQTTRKNLIGDEK